MAFLSGYRNTSKMGSTPTVESFNLPIADNVKIYVGGMVAIDSAGNARPASQAGVNNVTAGLVVVGKAEVPYQPNPTIASPQSTYDNTVVGHAAGAISVQVRSGIYKWANSATTDLITSAHVGQMVFAADDQTVALTDGAGARAIAGRVIQVDSDGVWVASGITSAPQGRVVMTLPLDMTVLANGQAIAAFAPGFSGRIAKIQYIATKAATGAGATATLTPRITAVGGAATALTGGVTTPTLANAGALGAVVAGTAITGNNYFGPQDTIDLQTSAYTAFTAGTGYLLVTLTQVG